MSTFDEPPVPPSVPPPKTEEGDEDSFSDSSHDFDGPEEYVQEAAQVQKRKGGRKPVGIFSQVREKCIADPALDICNIRREETAKPPSAGSLPGAED